MTGVLCEVLIRAETGINIHHQSSPVPCIVKIIVVTWLYEVVLSPAPFSASEWTKSYVIDFVPFVV